MSPKQTQTDITQTMLQLTSDERRVIIFVMAMLLIGIGVDFFKKATRRGALFDKDTLIEQLFDKVDVNRATFAELITVPEMGRKLAGAIIQYRQECGPFQSLDGLKDVRGIKDKKFEQIRKYLKVSP